MKREVRDEYNDRGGLILFIMTTLVRHYIRSRVQLGRKGIKRPIGTHGRNMQIWCFSELTTQRRPGIEISDTFSNSKISSVSF
jgi:hypothetical protein